MSELIRNKDLKNRVRFSTSLDKDLAKQQPIFITKNIYYIYLLFFAKK